MARKKSSVLSLLREKFSGKEDDSDIVQEINNKYTQYINDSRDIRRQWLINAAFARGQQWVVLSDIEDRLINLTAPGRKMVTDNLIRPHKSHYIANMIVALPEFQAVPPSINDSKSVTAARMGSSLLSHYWESWQFILDYIQIAGYMYDFGNALVYLNYIEDKRKFQSTNITDGITGDLITDNSGNPVSVQVPLGDITRTVLSPQCLACSLDDLPLEDKGWLTITQARELDYFAEQYPKDGDKVQPESVKDDFDYSLNQISRAHSDTSHRRKIEYANEKIYLQKPSSKCPEGLVVITANDVLLDRYEWPYSKLDTYPLVHFHDVKESGEFWARSHIDEVIPLQKSLNLIWSSLVENAEEMAHIKWGVPIQANIGEGKISDMPDIVRYNYPYKPEQLALSPIPEYIFGILSRLYEAIRDKQSYHGASLGTSVSGVRSDIHAQNLQEQDLLPLTTIDEIMRVRFSEMGEKILLIAAEKLTDDRIITYTNNARQRVVQTFRGEMLGNVHKVSVKLKNLHLRNRTAVIQNLIQAFQIGGIKDEYGRPDSEKFMQYLEFMLPDSELDDVKIHTQQAYLENDKLMEGTFIPVFPWQHHRLHMLTHVRQLNSPELCEIIEGYENPQQALQDPIISNLYGHYALHNREFTKQLSMLQPPPEKERQQQQNQSAKKG